MKPILFSTPMVQAILEGRKIMTRRAITGYPAEHIKIDVDGSVIGIYDQFEGNVRPETDYAKYHVGDILWVRETWTRLYRVDENGYTHFDEEMTFYAADGDPDIELLDGDGFLKDNQRIKWKPSIHMPREAARIFLRVTDVRAERVQSITEADAEHEGVIAKHDTACSGTSARIAFAELWDSLYKNRGYGWGANLFVWVIAFERIDKPETRLSLFKKKNPDCKVDIDGLPGLCTKTLGYDGPKHGCSSIKCSDCWNMPVCEACHE